MRMSIIHDPSTNTYLKHYTKPIKSRVTIDNATCPLKAEILSSRHISPSGRNIAMSSTGGLPPRTHPHWNAIAAGTIAKPWSMLGMKILMARVIQEVAKDKSQANITRQADEIYAFFKKNEKIAAADLSAIFG